jgi:hypothetical protein
MMKAELVTIEHDPLCRKRVIWQYQALITIKYVPNWFDILLGKVEYTKQFWGSALDWQDLDGKRCDVETEWWFHNIWARWLAKNGY